MNEVTKRHRIGSGVLNWRRTERISDRYGSVSLTPDKGKEKFAAAGSLLGRSGRLVVIVTEGRKSSHIGDFFRGLSPRQPQDGQEIVLGEGELFREDDEGIAYVGLKPADGRHCDWLDPRALYDCHGSVVDLFFEETT